MLAAAGCTSLPRIDPPPASRALDADNFIDIDVLAAGAVVPAMQTEFDRYWNAPTAYPLSTIVKAPAHLAGDAQALRSVFELATEPAQAELSMPAELAPRDVLGQAPKKGLAATHRPTLMRVVWLGRNRTTDTRISEEGSRGVSYNSQTRLYTKSGT